MPSGQTGERSLPAPLTGGSHRQRIIPQLQLTLRAHRLLDNSADALREYVSFAACASGSPGVVNVVQASELSYDAFVSRYMAANRPVLILVQDAHTAC